MENYYRTNGNIDFIGLSSEEKPTENIVNGSTRITAITSL